MAALLETKPRYQRRWLQIGLAAVLLAGVVGFGWWWFQAKAQLEAHQPFFGTWRRVSPVDSTRPGQVLEFGLRPDDTLDLRLWYPKTGTVVVDVKASKRWRVVNGRLQIGHYGMGLLNDIGLGPWKVVVHDGLVTWNGPDRFEYVDDMSSLGPQCWVRVDAVNEK
jgi:hypothetical protein